jgi:SpoVK/Ycf46/Vps4 family AAA+-type ATPase
MDLNELRELEDAVRNSPDNVPLRKLLANALMKARRYEEAETEWKEALRLAPADVHLKLGLANAFYEQQKLALGLVVVEELLQLPLPPASVWLLNAKLLLKSKQPREAQESYEKAVLIDSNLRDAFLESDINLQLQSGIIGEPERIKLRQGGDYDDDFENSSIEIERPKIRFDSVGGMERVKEEIRLKIIHPLQHPDIYKAYGKKIGGGILLYGPPGCGKTHLARATAGEIQSSFISVGISDILDMYIGQSERNLHALFEKARSRKPCVLFFDEVDALGASRNDMRQSAGRHLINQFLDEMDGITADNEGVLILAATNAPWHLDAAFRRPGRFDRIIFVPPPDEAAREAIFKIELQGKPLGRMDFNRLARKTAEFSGADIKAVVDIAIESKLAEAMRKGVPTPLETDDLENALKKHKATTREWFGTAKNYALFANEAGLYDDILEYLKIKK